MGEQKRSVGLDCEEEAPHGIRRPTRRRERGWSNDRKDTGHATVLCALCNLKDEFPAHPAAQAIDVYSFFTDRFYGVKEPRAIIPHEREFEHAPSEEGPAEEEVEIQPPEAEMAPEPSPHEAV